MEDSKVIQAQQVLADYLTTKKLRLTEERVAILKCICGFSKHFDINTLHTRLEKSNFHVSKATLYNNIELFIACGLIVRHQFTQQVVQYELREKAEKHVHLVCVQCGNVKESNAKELLAPELPKLRTFYSQYKMTYVYGLCCKCKPKAKKVKKEYKY